MLENWTSLWTKNGCYVEVVEAPKDACSFNKMILVFRDNTKKSIVKVQFYNSKTGKVVGSF